VDSALVHRARRVDRVAGERDDEGEYELEDRPGPWFAARLMERGGVGGRDRRRGGQATDARTERGYELLAGPVDEAGAPLVLEAGDLVETECPVLGSPTVELAGRPEKLNQGDEHIGWVAYATVAGDQA
jgi:hypothetical protein